MRPGQGPLLQAVSKGRPPGSPRLQRSPTALVIGLVLVATAGLLVLRLDRSSDGSGGGAAGDGIPIGDSSSSSVRGRPRRDASSDPVAAAAAAAVATSPPDPVSLAAAQKRARKAATLPKPEFRSHADGLALAPGAAEAVAACRGERCDLLTRFLLAVEETRRLVDTGGCAVQHCPDALGIGARPLPITSHALGNRCEPLYNRGALELVRQLVQPDWRGLEWFTGGSTAWFLARLAHLTSIEAAPGFAAKARSVAEAQFDAGFLAARWDLHVVPPAGHVATFADTEDGQLFGDYCAAAFVPDGTRFDVISVQGFARMTCLRRAVQLLRPQGGLLVLAQAQRPAYKDAAALVPPHWLRLTDSHAFGQTTVWVSMRA